MNIQTIRIIARHESKYLWRNLLFQGIAWISLVLIFTLQYFHQSKETANYWFMIALPSSIPFINTYLFTIVQSILIILAVHEWRGSEKRADTLEAIRVKAFSNPEYITGKSLGIVSVILMFNILSLITALGINLFDSDSPFRFSHYLFYLLTLSFPAALFMTGVSVVVTSLIRNRGISLFILFSFFIGTLYGLPEIQHGLFDYRANHLPNVFSEFTGHVDLTNYLIHRAVFLCLGMSCFVFAISLKKRLSNDVRQPSRSCITATGILLIGILTGINYYHHFWEDDSTRTRYRETALKYNESATTQIPTHTITIRQENDRIKGTSCLQLVNPADHTINRILLYLNPTLEITRFTDSDGKEIGFHRENQVIEINRELSSKEAITLFIDYQGKIDERVCYLDVETKQYWNNKFRNCPLRFGKRYAYVENEYTLLTPECLWYPASILPVNLASPYTTEKGFTRFHLNIITTSDKTVVSQGESTRSGDTTQFQNKQNLPGITLCMGHYEKRSIEVDSITMELYTFKGHNHIAALLNELTEQQIKKTIQKCKQYVETSFGKEYPFARFILAETPVSFTTNFRPWRSNSGYIQPEIALFPERWINQEIVNVRKTIKQIKNTENTRAQIGMSDQKTAAETFIEIFTRKVFIPPYSSFHSSNIFIPNFRGTYFIPEKTNNAHHLQPLFFNFSSYIYSKEYPIMGKALPTLVSRKNLRQGNFEGSDETYQATKYLATHSLKEAMSDKCLPERVFNMILSLKSDYLLDYISLKISPEKFIHFLNQYTQNNSFRELSFDSLCSELMTCHNVCLKDMLHDWFYAKNIPGYIVKDIKASKITSEESDSHQISFKIYNNTSADGIISTNTEVDNKWKTYFIPAGTSWEIKEINEKETYALNINLNLSRNLPNGIKQDFFEINTVTQDISHGKFAIDNQQFLPLPGEIIVDNEDEGFQLKEVSKHEKLISLFNEKQDRKYVYKDIALRHMGQKIPSEWTYCLGPEDFYGDIIKSVVYKQAGHGNSRAEWTGELPEPGRYEVYIYTVSEQMTLEGIVEQYYTLTTREGEEKITLKIDPLDQGWVSIGVFDFPAGKVKITLNDQGIDPGQLIFADAVKWKYVDK